MFPCNCENCGPSLGVPVSESLCAGYLPVFLYIVFGLLIYVIVVLILLYLSRPERMSPRELLAKVCEFGAWLTPIIIHLLIKTASLINVFLINLQRTPATEASDPISRLLSSNVRPTTVHLMPEINEANNGLVSYGSNSVKLEDLSSKHRKQDMLFHQMVDINSKLKIALQQQYKLCGELQAQVLLSEYDRIGTSNGPVFSAAASLHAENHKNTVESGEEILNDIVDILKELDEEGNTRNPSNSVNNDGMAVSGRVTKIPISNARGSVTVESQTIDSGFQNNNNKHNTLFEYKNKEKRQNNRHLKRYSINTNIRCQESWDNYECGDVFS